MTPYNAQATIFFPSGFWSLYLPISVAGRVSDIWRSYFAQALFKRIGVHLGFLPRPLVVQDRNPHSYEADFNAEIPLYTKSSALISYLLKNYVSNDDGTEKSFIEILETLWIDMYERDYIGKADVVNMQLWIDALIRIGYQFPTIKSTLKSNKSSARNRTIKYDIKKILEERKKLNKIGHSINQVNNNDLKSNKTTEGCDSQKFNVVFGTSDLHDGPRTDMSSTLATLNQTFIHVGPRKISQNYPDVVKLPQVKFDRQDPSPILKIYNDHSTKMNPSWPLKNSEWYARRSVGTQIDAFICTFPASMCQLWIPMNKSIVFLPAHRYNLGRCSVDEWQTLNDDILRLKATEIDGGHTVGAVSRYDMEYIKYYTGIQPSLVPSYSGFYINHNLYKGDKKEILIFGYDSKPFNDLVIKSLAPELPAVHVYELYQHYTPEDLGRHRAVVTLPYSVMSYRTTELYALGIPIFAPSIKFLMSYCDIRNKEGLWSRFSGEKSIDMTKSRFGLGWDRTSTSDPYCTNDPNLEQKMRPKANSSNSIHPYSPNIDILEDVESENYWLQFADFYDWPHIQHFDDYEHLKKLLLKTDFLSVHKNMKKELKIRENKVIKEWCDITRKIDKHKSSRKNL